MQITREPDVFDQPETMWMQFRRRLDHVHPYCRIAGHTEGEVRDILLALERIYRPSCYVNLQEKKKTLPLSGTSHYF